MAMTLIIFPPITRSSQLSRRSGRVLETELVAPYNDPPIKLIMPTVSNLFSVAFFLRIIAFLILLIPGDVPVSSLLISIQAISPNSNGARIQMSRQG